MLFACISLEIPDINGYCACRAAPEQCYCLNITVRTLDRDPVVMKEPLVPCPSPSASLFLLLCLPPSSILSIILSNALKSGPRQPFPTPLPLVNNTTTTILAPLPPITTTIPNS